jgi:prepilin-type N-terminal cleavage/methylation domain-containing protein
MGTNINCNDGTPARNGFSKAAHGFTLVEAMMVLAIFSIGILTAGSLQTRAVLVNSSAAGSTQASALAAAWMERLIGEDFDAPVLRDRTRDGTAGLNACTSSGADGSHTGSLPYTVFWNVAQVPKSYDPATINYKQVRVIVTWNQRGTRRRLPLDHFRVDF